MLFTLRFLTLLRLRQQQRCLKRIGLCVLMGAITMGAYSNAYSSGEDGGAFAAAQAAEAQKEVDKLLAQDKSIALMRQPGQSTPESSIQILGGMKEQLNAIKAESAKIIDRGNLMKGLNTKAGCPSQLFNKGGEVRGNCSSKTAQSSLFPQDEEMLEPGKKDQLLVFVSFSMPEASLKSLAQAAEQQNAVLVMRGLYEDSFVKTTNKLKELGIGVDINPELFTTHQVTAVPTFVSVKSGQPLWRLKGNVTLGFVANKFKEKLAGEQRS